MLHVADKVVCIRARQNRVRPARHHLPFAFFRPVVVTGAECLLALIGQIDVGEDNGEVLFRIGIPGIHRNPIDDASHFPRRMNHFVEQNLIRGSCCFGQM